MKDKVKKALENYFFGFRTYKIFGSNKKNFDKIVEEEIEEANNGENDEEEEKND